MNDVCEKFNSLIFLKAGYELHNLQPHDFYKLSGDPLKWPELMKISGHMFVLKSPFQATKEWRLFNLSDGEAKTMVQFIGKSGIFYPTVLKCLKRDYLNPTVVSYLKLKKLCNQQRLQPKNNPEIRSFQQQLKTTIT